jgi:hypothetical protein
MPLRGADTVFEALAQHLGTLAPRYPDGEQAGWIQHAQRQIAEHPALEPIPRSESSAVGVAIAGYRLKAEVRPNEVSFGSFGHSKNAITSYREFKRLKDAGTIPSGTRFQVTLPAPGQMSWSIHMLPQHILPILSRALWQDVREILEAIPAEDLTIHLDLGMDVAYEEYLRRPWAFDRSKGPGWMLQLEETPRTLDQTTTAAAWVVNQVPANVEVGFHLCSMWHGYRDAGQDNHVLVDVANALTERITRPIAYIHVPIIPEHNKVKDFQPFARLKLQPDTQLYLGLINLEDGLEGARKRIELANAAGLANFGVGFFCGMGRPGAVRIPGQSSGQYPTEENIGEVLDLHRQVAEL